MDFFNTINLSGNKLKESRDKCSQQQLDVLEVFESKPKKYTAWMVHDELNKSMLITSVRRSMTQLVTKGYLRKTDEMKHERQGKPNYLYELL